MTRVLWESGWEVSENKATPWHHPFIDWIFHEINHPAIGGTPILRKKQFSMLKPMVTTGDPPF